MLQWILCKTSCRIIEKDDRTNPAQNIKRYGTRWTMGRDLFLMMVVWKIYIFNKARFQKKLKLVEFWGGWGSGWVDFPLRKKNKKRKNSKMIRMVQFIQKTQDLNFLLLGGSGQISGLIVWFNDLNFLWSFFFKYGR